MARDYTLVENFKKWEKYAVVLGSGFKAGLKTHLLRPFTTVKYYNVRRF